MRALIILMLFVLALGFSAYGLQLRVGDLLFQDINCGSLCKGIFSVTHGYDHRDVSHVAMVVSTGKNPMAIEAVGGGVQLTPLKMFLSRSVDENNQPRVMVGRLKPAYQTLIPRAVKISKSWLGLPYNSTFTPNNHQKSFYCSQLIDQAFSKANHGVAIFKADRMNYKNPQTHDFFAAWVHYFKTLKAPIPQGQWGTNPAALSRSNHLDIVYTYGDFTKHEG